jgi:hypothetical protein
MDNVGVVVEDLPATIAFFRELIAVAQGPTLPAVAAVARLGP